MADGQDDPTGGFTPLDDTGGFTPLDTPPAAPVKLPVQVQAPSPTQAATTGPQPPAPAQPQASDDMGGFTPAQARHQPTAETKSALDQWLNDQTSVKDRGDILPIGRDPKTGKVEFAVPEMARSILRGIEAFRNPNEAANNPQTIQDLVNAGMMFTPAGPETRTLMASRAAAETPRVEPRVVPEVPPEAPPAPPAGFAKPVAPEAVVPKVDIAPETPQGELAQIAKGEPVQAASAPTEPTLTTASDQEPGFTTNPAKIAQEHQAEVSQLEAEGTAAAQKGMAPEEPPPPANGIPRDEGGDFVPPPPEAGQGSLFQWIRGQEDDLTRIRGQNEADRTEAMNFIKTQLPEELKDPVLNEKLYNAIEDPTGVPLTPEEQALSDQYIKPIREEANGIINRLRGQGVPIGMDGYVHRIAKGKGTMYDPVEGPPAADAFAGNRGLNQTTSALKGRRMWMAEGPNGEQQIVRGNYKQGQTLDGLDGQDGQWRIRQATTKEIEDSTNVRYYKNAVANSLDSLLRLRRVERNVNYLNSLKEDPTFKEMAVDKRPQSRGIGDNDEPIPAGWKTTQLPQLAGFYMEPRVARMLDNFYQVGPQTALGQTLAKVNHGLTSAIFVNPISALFGHGLNVATHWYVGRGWDNFLPQGWAKSSRNMMRAFNDVQNQTPAYQQMLREGNSLMYAPTINRDFHQTMIKLMGGEVAKNPKTWGEIAKAAGTSPAYIYRALSNLSSRGLWFANDVLMLQRVYDLQDKGLSAREAITEAEHEIPNYRVPSEAWDPEKMRGGAAFSEAMSNPNLTIFGRYRYGLIHAYAKTIGDLVGKDVAPANRAKAAGQMLALGTLFGVLYPLGDQMAKSFTGNQHATMRRSGPTTVLQSLKGWLRGKPQGDDLDDVKNLYTGISGLFGPAPGSLALGETLLNREAFTGKHVYNPAGSPLDVAKQLGMFWAGQPYPVQQAEELAGGQKNRQEIEESWLGINAPTAKEMANRRRYAAKDYAADKKAFANKSRRLMNGLKSAYHSVFGVGNE